MALDAFGHNHTLILLPITVRMNIRMAISTHDIFVSVHTGVMFGSFFLVTAFTMHLFYHYLALHMHRQIGELYVAAVTAIFAMYGIAKSGSGNFIAVATQAGGGIDGHLLGGRKRLALHYN